MTGGRGRRGPPQRVPERGLRGEDRDHRPAARSGRPHGHRAHPGPQPRRSASRSACSERRASWSVRPRAPAKRVVVPLAAVTRVANKDVVFVRQPDGDFELHPVTLGRAAGGRVRGPERAARGRAGRRRRRLHAQERDPQEHVRRGGVRWRSSAASSPGRCATAPSSWSATAALRDRRRPLGDRRCRSTPSPTSRTSRSRSSRRRPRSRPIEVEQYVTRAGRARDGRASRRSRRSGRSRSTACRSSPSSSTTAPTSTSRASWCSSGCARREEAVPAHYGRPEMGPIATGLGEVYQFVVRGEGHSLMELEETLDWYIGPQLRTVPGVVEVNSFGGEDKQYQVVHRSRSASRPRASRSREVRPTRSRRPTPTRAAATSSTTASSFVIGTVGLVTSLDDLESRRRRRDAAGRADHRRDRRRRALRPAPAPRRRLEGRQGRGRRRRRADADGRELAHRHRARSRPSSTSCSPSLPAGHHGRAVLRPRRARRPDHPAPSATNLAEGAALVIAGAAPPARQPPRRAHRRGRPSRCRCCSRSSLMNADRASRAT